MKKTIFKSLFSILVLLGIIVSGLLSLVKTEAGARIIVWTVIHQLPGRVSYSGLQGTIEHQITLKQITYLDTDIKANANDVKLNLNLKKLLNLQLPIINASIHNVNLTANEQRFSFNDITLKGNDKLTLTTNMVTPIKQKIQAVIDPSIYHFSAKLEPIDLPISDYTSFLHPELKLSTKIQLSATSNNYQTTIKLALSPGSATLPIDHKLQKFPFNGGKINITLAKHRMDVKLDINFVQKSTITGQLSIPKLKKKTDFIQQKIQGNINWHFPDVSFLAAFIDNISDTHGDLSINFAIKGTLKKPMITGTSQLHNASLLVPKINASLKDVELTATANGEQLNYQASAIVGDGKLTLTGHTKFTDHGMPTQLHVIGNNATIFNSDEIRINATPDINIQWYSNQLSLRGNIFIPSANIEPKDFSSTTTLPDDIIIIDDDKEPKKPTPTLQVTSDIELRLGEYVKLKTLGLSGNVIGKLRIHDSANQPTTAQGELSLQKGQYEKYGAKLEVPKGKFIYTGGPINNPALNIEAIRTFSQKDSFGGDAFNQPLTTGIRITGTLQNPTTKLFSNLPKQNQSDTLSYLITGQGIDQANSNQVELLLQAASAIDFGGPGKLSNLRNEIKNKLGLSELGLGTEESYDKQNNRVNHHTSLVLGKYLSPKLYVKYSFDILDHTPKLKISYSLNNNWSVQTESSTIGSGVDLLYTIERK